MTSGWTGLWLWGQASLAEDEHGRAEGDLRDTQNRDDLEQLDAPGSLAVAQRAWGWGSSATVGLELFPLESTR